MKKRVIMALFIIVVISSAVITIIFQMNKSANIADQFVVAVKNEDIDQLKQLFQGEEADVFVDVPLEQFLQYVLKNDDKLQMIKTSIQEQVESEKTDLFATVQVIIEEKKYGIFPTYYLALRKSQLQMDDFYGDIIDVKTDHAILKKRHVNEWIYGPIFPGEHLIEIQIEHELGQFIIEKQVEIWDQAITKIRLDEEEILLQDEYLKEHLYKFGALFTDQLEEIKMYENQTDIISNSSAEMDKILKEGETLLLEEVVVDEDSYNLMRIQDIWYAEVRMIGTYNKQKQKSDDSTFILFTFEMMFDPYDNEWGISDIKLSLTEQSIIDLWNSTVKFDSKDLQLADQIDKVL